VLTLAEKSLVYVDLEPHSTVLIVMENLRLYKGFFSQRFQSVGRSSCVDLIRVEPVPHQKQSYGRQHQHVSTPGQLRNGIFRVLKIDRRVVDTTGVLALLNAGSCWIRVKSRMQHILEINFLWSIDVGVFGRATDRSGDGVRVGFRRCLRRDTTRHPCWPARKARVSVSSINILSFPFLYQALENADIVFGLSQNMRTKLKIRL
jgi:hypothetical protein